ncbi:unnamed protein product [Paramecium primaurelia]|uniref:Uncharacterized protein n=1 Tax=Paramecium primaurelia TaxID=5886 RepID=A0A8S1QDN7_PARPR|nr:unnamed protein product [Paramecium primaurelia]
MRFILLIFFLEYSNFFGVKAGLCQENLFQRQKHILRGLKLDVASTFHGSFLSTARTNIFWRKDIDDNPLRFSLYYSYPTIVVGHIVMPLGTSAIVEFLQSYEINTIRFWMWEGGHRITNMQVFVIGVDGITETIVFDGLAQPAVVKAKFSSQIVSKIRFFNRGGNTVDSNMSIIKIQAYYAF